MRSGTIVLPSFASLRKFEYYLSCFQISSAKIQNLVSVNVFS